MPEYPFFPMFVDLSRRRVLSVGGGRIAARRVSALVQFCPSVTVVAPSIHPDIAALADAGRARVLLRPYCEADLEGMDVVLACTDDGALNAAVAAACRERGIPVNVASDKGKSDFYFPGVAVKEHAVIGVTASGKDHEEAKRLTEAVRELLEKE